MLNDKWLLQESLDENAQARPSVDAGTADAALYCQCARRFIATGPGVLGGFKLGRSAGWWLFPEACGDACGCTPAGQGHMIGAVGAGSNLTLTPTDTDTDNKEREPERRLDTAAPANNTALSPRDPVGESLSETYFREAGLAWPTAAKRALAKARPKAAARPEQKLILNQKISLSQNADLLPWDAIGLAEASYKFVVEQEPPTRCSASAMPPPELLTPCPRVADRQILVAMMLVNEVDTLEIALAEYTGLADILITENRMVHNPKIKTFKPHLLWPRLRTTNRFKPYLERGTRVFFHECTRHADKARAKDENGHFRATDIWEAERIDTACLSDKVKELAAGYQVVIVGSVDELTARKNVHDLKYCAEELKHMPRGSAASMPYGMVGRSYRPDFHYENWTTGFALPTFYSPDGDTVKGSSTFGQFRRYNSGMEFRFHPPPDSEPVVGGMHLTMYCYLPSMVLKETWITDHPGALNMGDWCSKSLADIKDQQCYSKKRTFMGYGPEHIVPYALAQCPETFPSWYGRIDPREEAFYRRMCGGHTREQWARLKDSANNTGFVEPHPGYDCHVDCPGPTVGEVGAVTEEQCQMKCVMDPDCTGISFDRPPPHRAAPAESTRPALSGCKLLRVKVADCNAVTNGNWVFSEKKKWEFRVVKPGFDCQGGELFQHKPTSLYQIESICANDPNCTGFGFKGGRSWRTNPKLRRSEGWTRQITLASCNKSLQKSTRGWEFWWRHDVTHAPPEPIDVG